MLEAAKVQHYPFNADEQIRLADWERFIHEIGNDMIKEQTPRKYVLCATYPSVIFCISGC